MVLFTCPFVGMRLNPVGFIIPTMVAGLAFLSSVCVKREAKLARLGAWTLVFPAAVVLIFGAVYLILTLVER